MQNKSINGSSTSFLSRFQWKHVLELAVPLAFFMLLFFFFPFLERFKLDPDEGFNAIFVGATGSNRIKRMLLGGVTDDIIHYAHCPVTVVR